MSTTELWHNVLIYAMAVLMKTACFILGYLTIRLGYLLIASGAKGEFKFAASLGNLKGNLASVSPGLLFVMLGVFFMAYAIYVPKGPEIVYQPVVVPAKVTKDEPPVNKNKSLFNPNVEDSNNVENSTQKQEKEVQP